ncbi:MAG: cellulase family glycosylhydrolase [Clostridia bacterium]|nr:cellulase family glycosylhydrolase [Clostridia bacterium]
MKRLLSFATAMVITVTACCVPTAAANENAAMQTASDAVINYNRSVPLEVKGNRIVEKGTDNIVTLRGVNIPSMGWGMAEHIFESMTEVYDSWHANIIRLPIQPKYWFNGNYENNVNISPERYRQYVDDMVRAAQARGKYIILDCHTYVMPLNESLEMWKDIAAKYANNSAVLFGLLNEPHDIKPTGVDSERGAWDVWRNGGQITISDEEVTGVGHQQLLEAIRKTGANNICIAGGLNWAFDISGLADGYDGLEHGYRLTDTADGNGVIYDSHAYPVKGAKDSWNKTIGPVRRVAPILIGEWGWDSSDSAISGGDCTSDIWMNQLMNWMDDTYGDYDGVPVNWTGWNLHMSSSPRMIDSWDFKTTAYNGTYIKKRLQSYDAKPEQYDGVYSTDFSTDNVFRSYTGVTGKSSVTYSEDNKNVVIYHQPTGWSGKFDFPYDWDLNGIQTITMDVSADITETINIGLYGSDMEAWTKPVEVDTNVKTIVIGIDELTREGNAVTDGVLNGALSGIYFGGTATAKGNITVDNVKITKLANPTRIAKECPHVDEGIEMYLDVDNTDFASQKLVNGPGTGSYFKSENATVPGADGKDTTAKHITYNRINGPWGGSAQYNLAAVPTKDAKYFTVSLKGSGDAQTIGVSIGDIATFNVTMSEGDTDWHQYIYCMDGAVEYPEDIKYVKFTSGTKIESSFYADDFGFSIEKPERKIPFEEKTFVYDFATYNRNTAKYEAKISTTAGSDGDSITAAKADGGMDYDTQALEVKYTINGSARSKALVVYSSSDFFKGNAGDDDRTACRKTLKADMEYMTDLVFCGKSTSGKNERINVSVFDASNVMSTPTDTKTFTLTDKWEQYRIPFEEFNVLDGGKPLAPARVRGFAFSSAESSGSGSFMIDNITHTNAANIEWSEPTPAPEPTPRIITTAEEALALTASDERIKLGSDIDLGTGIMKTKCDLYLDLNGYTLSGGGNGVIDATNNLTILDSSEARTGKIYNTSTGTSSYAVKSALNLTINGGMFCGGQGILASNSTTKYTLTVNGGTFEAVNASGFAFNISNHDVIINDCKAYNNAATSGGAIKLVGTSQVTINGGILNSAGYVLNNAAASGTVTINGGNLYNSAKDKGVIYATSSGATVVNGGTISNTDTVSPVVISVYKNATGDIELKDGYFAGKIAKDSASTSNITVSGGTYTVDPTAYAAEGAEITENDKGEYIVNGGYDGPVVTPLPTEEPTETTIPTAAPTPAPTATPAPGESTPTPVPGRRIVTTAEEFIGLTGADGDVILGADIDLGTTGFKTRCNLVLDLNGHTLTSNCSAVIEMSHKLTVIDTAKNKGAVINSATSATSYGIKCAIKNTELIIDGAMICARAQAVMVNGTDSTVKIKNAVINGGSYAINLANGILTVENTVTNSSENYKGYALYASGGRVTVNGGEFNYNGTVSSIVAAAAAEVTINDGKFTNPNAKRGVINNTKGYYGTLTINGGTFENTYNGTGYSILDGDEATTETAPNIIINGGTFLDGIGFSKPANTTTKIEVKGGTFAFDPTDYVDTEKYRVTAVGDYYTVTAADDEPTTKPTEAPAPAPTSTPAPAPTEEPTEEPAPDVYSYNVTYDENLITVEVKLPSYASEDDVMYIAAYDTEEKLIGIYVENDIQGINRYDSIENAADIRVFIWDKYMKPLVRLKD